MPARFLFAILHTMSRTPAERLLSICAIWTVLSIVVMLALTVHRPIERAATFMVLGVAFLWVLLGGWLIFRYRERVKEWIGARGGPRDLWFLALAILCMLAEEGISTAMTNLAPIFGVPLGGVAITSSTRFFTVVFLHGTAVVPMFIAWLFLLRAYRFEPIHVFLLFGLNGVLAEVIHGAAAAVIGFGYWIWVYGLMIYLSAYAASPEASDAIEPGLKEYFYAAVFPVFCSVLLSIILQHLIHRSPL
jgi:hypothetical protein